MHCIRVLANKAAVYLSTVVCARVNRVSGRLRTPAAPADSTMHDPLLSLYNQAVTELTAIDVRPKLCSPGKGDEAAALSRRQPLEERVLSVSHQLSPLPKLLRSGQLYGRICSESPMAGPALFQKIWPAWKHCRTDRGNRSPSETGTDGHRRMRPHAGHNGVADTHSVYRRVSALWPVVAGASSWKISMARDRYAAFRNGVSFMRIRSISTWA